MMNVNYRPDPAVTVSVNIGALPPGWQDGVVFVANLECIFFGEPEKTKDIVSNVKGFQSYGARLLPILGLLYQGRGNLLLLPRQPDASLVHYYGEKLDLDIPETTVVNLPDGCSIGPPLFSGKNLEYIRNHPAPLMDGYVTDPELEKFAHAMGKKPVNTYQSCRNANDKIMLFDFLARAGLPVFDGCKAAIGGPMFDAFVALRKQGYKKAVIRASLGASGFGMHLADLEKVSADEFPHRLFAGETEVLVHGWIEESVKGAHQLASPSVQFFCGQGKKVTLYDITDQLLSRNSIHEGNMSPPSSLAAEQEVKDEILRQAGEVGRWIASLGYRGPGSVDFLVFKKQAQPQVHVCEVNARVTGATYPSLLALKVNPGGAWLMRNMVFGPCMTTGDFLTYLEAKKILYLPREKRGILPINTICTANGEIIKCQLLFLAKTSVECLKMIEEFPSLLPAECRFDRD